MLDGFPHNGRSHYRSDIYRSMRQDALYFNFTGKLVVLGFGSIGR